MLPNWRVGALGVAGGGKKDKKKNGKRRRIVVVAVGKKRSLGVPGKDVIREKMC